ncbi:MAG: FG-GAP-like repeat-containing protein [Planctomycetota bacterium]
MMHRTAPPLLLAALCPLAAADGEILDIQTIHELEGGLGPVLHDDDGFGASIDRIGDLDGNGLVDLIVGAPGDDDAGSDAGAAYVLFLDADGTVLQRTKIAAPSSAGDFGRAVAQVGDLNSDGTTDVAIGRDRGVELFTLQPDGSAALWATIDATDHIGTMLVSSEFGASLTRLGDLNNDGIEELAVGDPADDIGGADRGAVYVYELVPGVIQPQLAVLASGSGGFLGALSDDDEFGTALAAPGDVDGDGVGDLAVGTPGDDDGGTNEGAVWLLFLNADGSVRDEQKISALFGAPAHLFDVVGSFGSSLARAGDLDGGGGPELLVGATGVFVLFLRTDGTVRSFLDYDDQALFGGTKLKLGRGLCAMEDHDGDGEKELVLGDPGDDTAGVDRGALHVLFAAGVEAAQVSLHGCGAAPPGSLELSDAPFLGSSFDFLVDNPLGSQNPGALPFVALSTVDIASPCGAPIPGLGMTPGGLGELLVLAPFVVPELIGPAWAGPGQPAAVPAALPQEPELLGLSLYAQGLLFDPTGGPTGLVELGLTRGLELVIGT